MADKNESSAADDFLDGELLLEDVGGNNGLFDGDNIGDEETDFDTEDEDEDEDGDLDDDEDQDDEDDEDDEDADDDEEDEDEDEDDPEGKGDDNADADADSNEFYLRAKYWQESGVLPADAEIKKDLTQLELEQLYVDQVKENTLNQLKTEFKDVLRENGVDVDKIFNGESEDEFFKRQYEYISSLDYDKMVAKDPTKVTATLRTIGTEYWTAKTNEALTEEEVKDLVDKDLDKNTEEEALKKYQKFFGTEAKRLEKKIQDDTQAKAKAAVEEATKNSEYIKDKLSKGEVGGRKLTDIESQKVLDAFYKKDQTYDDGKGTRRVGISLFEKMRLEMAGNIDRQLEYMVDRIIGKADAGSKEKNQQIGKVDILSKLATATGVSGGKKSTGKHKKTTSSKQKEFEKLLLD